MLNCLQFKKGADDVFVCQSDIDGTSVIVKDTYNPNNTNNSRYAPNAGEHNQDDIILDSVEWLNHDSLILCRFQRTLQSNPNSTIDKDLASGSYYIFFALGNSKSK